MRFLRSSASQQESFTPYREAIRYRRLLMASMLLNFVLAAALLHCLR